jgi:hypothetical protein
VHVTASPLLVELPTGQPARITVSITNTSALIDAYSVRAFGLDPQWMDVSTNRLSLFPSEVGTVDVGVALPEDFPAGLRQVAIHVQSENDPAEFALAQITLDVGTRSRTTLRVDPVTVTGGNKAQFALIIGNEGNSTVQARPQGVDPEDKVEIGFEPPLVVLPPGRREVVQANVQGGRPWFGQPKPRVLSFSLGPDSPPAMATFLQRARIGRWLISLLGLATVAAVFAVVLSTVMDDLVAESKTDDALLDEALANEDAAAGPGENVSVTPSMMSGRVVLSNDTGVAGVQVELYSSGNGSVPLASAATDPEGKYAFGRLSAGLYRLRYTGAGFNEQWYVAAITFADAKDVEVPLGEDVKLDDVQLGGRPGSVAGEVIVTDPSDATARLVVPGVADKDTKALVDEVTVSADGSFLFEEVPSPAEYQLVVDKPGFATEVRRVVLGAAEQLDGIEVVMREGDGVISGRIDSPAGPLGGVTVEATDGTVTVSTVSLTLDDVGFFALRSLPTPGQYTVTFEREGYSSATRTFDLAAEQQLEGVAVTLDPRTGSLSGTVRENDGGRLGGVTVSVSGADVQLSTTTASQGAVGHYTFTNLPSPATYTVTFAKPGFVGQTRLEDLDPQAGRIDVAGVDASLIPSRATIQGIVRNFAGTPVAGAKLVLTDGTTTRELRSANEPAGRFEFSAVEPGAYTVSASVPGTSPTVLLVNVAASDVSDLDIALDVEASLFGRVNRRDAETGVCNPWLRTASVRLFLAENFPHGDPLKVTTTDGRGVYEFGDLDAPDDFVIAVYSSASSADALGSQLVQTIPSRHRKVDAFCVEVPS